MPWVKVGVDGKVGKGPLRTNKMSARNVLIDLNRSIYAIIPLGFMLNIPDIVESQIQSFNYESNILHDMM